MIRRLIAVALLLALVAPLAGCGRKNEPEPPPGEPSHFPHTYPNPKSL